MNNLPWRTNSWEVAAQIAARQRQNVAGHLYADSDSYPHAEMSADPPLPLRVAANAQLLLQTVIVPGPRTGEGKLIEAVTIPWFAIVALLKQDPNMAFQIPAEKWEEIVAGAYRMAGFEEVTLTPRSGDYGRDVIAIKRGIGLVRVIDQVKAFRPPHLVTANDVRALIGVLHGDGASKANLTTTSDFAPKIRTDPPHHSLLSCSTRIGQRGGAPCKAPRTRAEEPRAAVKQPGGIFRCRVAPKLKFSPESRVFNKPRREPHPKPSQYQASSSPVLGGRRRKGRNSSPPIMCDGTRDRLKRCAITDVQKGTKHG
jgi:hypothetical protein